MRDAILILCLCCLPAMSGCSSLLFALFGSHYSGGGSTLAAKEADYDDRVSTAASYGSTIPGASANPFSP
jgi:hypothetical protein